MSSTTVWQLEHDCGRLGPPGFSATVGFDQLAVGLTDVRAADCQLSAQLLGVQLPDFPHPIPASWVRDPYVRRHDLIATYERSAPQHLRSQIYWRYAWEELTASAHAGERVDGVQVLVSVQTDRLDLRPTVRVASRLAAEQVCCLMDQADDLLIPVAGADVRERPAAAAFDRSPLWVFRGDAGVPSIVLMVLPSDLVRVSLVQDGLAWRLEFALLDEHLEKGVIRRLQLAAWLVPSTADEFWARKLFGQLLSSPPPLTT